MMYRDSPDGCSASRITRPSRCCAAGVPITELASEPRGAEFASGARHAQGALLPIELSLAVETALGRLNEDQREAVLLKVYQGFKFEEMAEILECPVSTVKSRLYTALDLLKTTLAPTMFGSNDAAR